MLDDKHSASFDRDGYVVLRQVLGEDALEPVRQVITRYVDGYIAQLRDQGCIDQLHAEAPLARRWALAAADYQRRADNPPLARNWGQQHLLDRAVYDLYAHPRLCAIATALLGPELEANGDYWIRPKTPDDVATSFAWHQDSFYYGGQTSEHLQILSLWIPLVDVDAENGCLQFVPGSHRFGPIVWQMNANGHKEPCQEITHYGQPRYEPMQVGDVIAFHNLALHSSGINRSEQMRWSIDLRYMRAGQGYAWHQMGDEFARNFPGFVVHSADLAAVETWETWKARWPSE